MPDTRDRRRILVVDDEPRMIKFIRLNLEHDGFEVVEAADGLAALNQVRDTLPDLVLLDVAMPELDGFETLRLLREVASIPVIMLTARGEEDDRVRGLELGADDYVTKPFSPRAPGSPARAVLRRTESPAPADKTAIHVDDRLAINLDRREVLVEGRPVRLRPTEFRLLYHLVNNAGWVVPHDQLLAKVWGYEYREETHYLRLYINYLRQKLERDPANPQYILTERGVGYRFVDFRNPAR
jgi:DNA-binding response OmpR family regulator